MLRSPNNYFLLLIIPLFLVNCKKVCGTKSEFLLPTSEYVILEYDKETMYSTFIDMKPAKLSEKELILIEGLFHEMLLEHNAGQARALAKHNKENPNKQWKETGFELKTEGYKRQYVSVINKNGEKLVWVNFACQHYDDEIWKTRRLRVSDGGNCYYSFKVNLTTNEIYDLRINGVA